MTITPEPDGRISFSVLICAHRKRPGCGDRIELIFNPEHAGKAPAETRTRRLAGARVTDELHSMNSVP